MRKFRKKLKLALQAFKHAYGQGICKTAPAEPYNGYLAEAHTSVLKKQCRTGNRRHNSKFPKLLTK